MSKLPESVPVLMGTDEDDDYMDDGISGRRRRKSLAEYLHQLERKNMPVVPLTTNSAAIRLLWRTRKKK